MALLLLPLNLFLVFLLAFLLSVKKGIYSKIRESIVYALILTGSQVFICNELFSYFDSLKFSFILSFWLLDAIFLSSLLLYLNSVQIIRLSELASLYDVSKFYEFRKSHKILMLVTLFLFVLPLGFLTFYSPPNNFDAHSYHLNRVLYWIYDKNLNHFPTQHIQQLYHNVFAEYLVLDLMVLSGSDHYVGLIQFGSFLGSLVAISLLAKKLGMTAGGQLLSAIFLLTLPVGIFESTSAQVDYVACFFFISYVYFGFELVETKSPITLIIFLLSLTLGSFTKYTILIFALPFTVFFALQILKKYGVIYSLKVLAISLVLFIITFFFFIKRNYELFGSFISPKEDTRLFSEKIPVDKYSANFLLSGFIKNSSLHLGIPDAGFNRAVERNIIGIHNYLGVDIDDPQLRLDKFSVRYSVHEDMVPNTLHFYLIMISLVTIFFIRTDRKTKWFGICTIIGFILFCGMLKFQLWSSRTHMPFFAMGSIIVSFVVTRLLKWNVCILAIPLLLLSLVFVYGNPNKPIVPLKYLSKKLVAHIPSAICSQNSLEEYTYKTKLQAYYSFIDNENCHQLKQLLNFKDRSKLFKILDELGYYKAIKSETVFTEDRVKAYFLSHLDDYEKFRPLLSHVTGENKNIGVLFEQEKGFYHYLSALSTKFENPGQMKYIRYKREFSVLENAQHQFCYDYILCDSEDLYKKFLEGSNIDTVYRSSNMYLIKLKNQSCERDLF